MPFRSSGMEVGGVLSPYLFIGLLYLLNLIGAIRAQFDLNLHNSTYIFHISTKTPYKGLQNKSTSRLLVF